MFIKKIKVNNFKSFGESNNDLNDISNINVLIGRNNSGKSSILQALEIVFCPDSQTRNLQDLYLKLKNKLYHNLDTNNKPTVLIEFNMKYDELESIFGKGDKTYSNVNFKMSGKELCVILEKEKFVCEIDLIKCLDNKIESFDSLRLSGECTLSKDQITAINSLITQNSNIIQQTLLKHTLKYIPAVREIKRETGGYSYEFNPDGTNLTQTVRNYLENAEMDTKVISKNLNEILMEFFSNLGKTRIQIQKIGDYYEIFIEVNDGNELPLSNFGTGYIEMIIYLSNLILDIDNYSIICFEEPENNLHPQLQKELMDYLIEKLSDKQIFISTHSTCFIDYKIIKNVYKLTHDGKESKINTFYHNDEIDDIDLLKLLTLENSQFFFYDKVILVEGISDKLVLPHFANLLGFKTDKCLWLETGGKYTFHKYMHLLESFDVDSYVITDLDMIVDGLNKIINLTENPDIHSKLTELNREINSILDAKPEQYVIRSKKYKRIRDSYSFKYAYEKLKEIIEKIREHETEFEDEDLTILDYFFDIEEKEMRKQVLKEESIDFNDLILKLYDNNVFILKNGSIEDYYNSSVVGRNKFEKAVDAIENMKIDDLKEFKPEFDKIFDRIFN